MCYSSVKYIYKANLPTEVHKTNEVWLFSLNVVGTVISIVDIDKINGITDEAFVFGCGMVETCILLVFGITVVKNSLLLVPENRSVSAYRRFYKTSTIINDSIIELH